MSVHLRHIHSIVLAGVFLILAATSSSAQIVTSATSGGTARFELQFGAPSGEAPSCLAAVADENIVWGTSLVDPSAAACSTAASADDNIVWGTSDEGRDFDNIVWGTAVDDTDAGNIVWGTALENDNIVWGTAISDDNIVWGTRFAIEF